MFLVLLQISICVVYVTMRINLYLWFCSIFFIHLNITPTIASQSEDDIFKLPFLKRVETCYNLLLSQLPFENSKKETSNRNFLSQPLARLYSQKKEPSNGLTSYFFSKSDPSKQMNDSSLCTALTWIVPGAREIYDLYTKAIKIKDVISGKMLEIWDSLLQIPGKLLGTEEKRSLSTELWKIFSQIFG
ncbi:uncharacterized protein LOC123015513 [Tribolium madens]|uniref:uncharacterized protein LOC123015513 n=1 Tax=Tribolium madens TaxID=41895 RepID=UPI001CF764AC|nr:uncharacterized protein LOC123015513 [Tribolium madens]